MGKYNWDSLKKNLQQGVGEQKSDFTDPREWKLQRDENDNGTAIIRLLPGKGGTTPSIVRIYEHSFRFFNKATNKYRWYIEPSPASIKDLPCPVSEVYYELGDIGTEEAKKLQKSISRSVKFISNILVVKDPANPENDGKIFYWKYGVKLFEKFQNALEPTETQLKAGKKPIELFDPEEGANIVLDIARAGQFLNYDGTTIETPSRAFDTDEEMDEAVLEKCHDLTEFISPEHFKPYSELKRKFAWVIEKSPLESYLIANGSQVINKPYDKNDKSEGGSTASEEAPMPKTKAYVPKTKKAPEPEVSEDPATTENEEAVEVTPEPAPAPKKTAKKATKPAEVETDEDILSMLDDI
jgi:hypothetical protein